MEEKIFSKRDTNRLKGLAIIFMIYHHCFATVDRFEKYHVTFFPLSEKWGVLLSFTLKICVGMFVFLSAYGMTVSFNAREKKKVSLGKHMAGMTTGRLVNMMSGYMLVFILVHVISIILGNCRIVQVYGTGFPALISMIIDFFGLGDVLGTPMYLATWWYMSIAIILILIFPLLKWLYEKIGIYSVLLVTLIPHIFQVQYTNICRYFLAMILGVVFAEMNGIVKISRYQIAGHRFLSKIFKFLVELLLIYCLFKGRNGKYSWTLIQIWDSLLPLVVILFAYEFIVMIPVLKQVLEFLGKYSMTIFLTHNFFRVFWCPDFIYGFRSAWLIALMLLLISLLFAVLIEGFKRLIRYKRFVGWLRSKLVTIIVSGGMNEE